MAKTNYHEHFVKTKQQKKLERRQEKLRLNIQLMEESISKKYMKKEARQRRALRMKAAKYFKKYL